MLLSETENNYLRERYNPEGSPLRRHQLRMLEIMVEVDRICKKHNIDYILSSGTLIGAVRHGGFVPWDDDLDIEIERNQYNHFLRVVEAELPDWMEMQSNKTDPFYIAPYIKIRDKQSSIVEINDFDINYSMRGIYIDIFPIERLSRLFSEVSSRLHGHLLYAPSHKKLKNSYWLTGSYFILTKLVYPTFRLLSKWARCKYRNTAGSCFTKSRDILDFYPISKIKFEDSEFNAPNNCDSYLRKLYGDYTKLPDKIVMHTLEVTIEPSTSHHNS